MPTLEESWGAVAKNRGLIYWAADRIWKKYTGSCYRGMARAMRTRRNALSQDHENFLAYEDIVSAMTLAFVRAHQRLDPAKGTLGTYFSHWARHYEHRECWDRLPFVEVPPGCGKNHPYRTKTMIAQQSRWWVPLYQY